jgi:hypothetical protein
LLGFDAFTTRLPSLDQVLDTLYTIEKLDIPMDWKGASKMAIFVREILDPVQRSQVCRKICPNAPVSI